MEQEPKLRAVPPGDPGARREPLARADKVPPQNRTQLLLASALTLALVLLIWSYISLGSRIDSLEGEGVVLRAAVAERDELINAQRTRLDEVRSRVKELLQIVEEPVERVPETSLVPNPEASPESP